jgi:hypothetical protein
MAKVMRFTRRSFPMLWGGVEMRPLRVPAGEERLHQLRQSEPMRRAVAVEDRLDDGRREQRQLQQAAQIAAVDALRSGQLADRGVPALVQQLLVPKRARQRLH